MKNIYNSIQITLDDKSSVTRRQNFTLKWLKLHITHITEYELCVLLNTVVLYSTNQKDIMIRDSEIEAFVKNIDI